MNKIDANEKRKIKKYIERIIDDLDEDTCNNIELFIKNIEIEFSDIDIICQYVMNTILNSSEELSKYGINIVDFLIKNNEDDTLKFLKDSLKERLKDDPKYVRSAYDKIINYMSGKYINDFKIKINESKDEDIYGLIELLRMEIYKGDELIKTDKDKLVLLCIQRISKIKNEEIQAICIDSMASFASYKIMVNFESFKDIIMNFKSNDNIIFIMEGSLQIPDEYAQKLIDKIIANPTQTQISLYNSDLTTHIKSFNYVGISEHIFEMYVKSLIKCDNIKPILEMLYEYVCSDKKRDVSYLKMKSILDVLSTQFIKKYPDNSIEILKLSYSALDHKNKENGYYELLNIILNKMFSLIDYIVTTENTELAVKLSELIAYNGDRLLAHVIDLNFSHKLAVTVSTKEEKNIKEEYEKIRNKVKSMQKICKDYYKQQLASLIRKK